MKKYVKLGLIALLLILTFTFLTGCDDGVIPPIISSYTVYFNSYDGVSGYLYVDGVYEGYLYPYSYVTVSLSPGSHSVTLDSTYCGPITVSYDGQEFYIDSYYNVW